jgi:hypothetical protein
MLRLRPGQVLPVIVVKELAIRRLLTQEVTMSLSPRKLSRGCTVAIVVSGLLLTGQACSLGAPPTDETPLGATAGPGEPISQSSGPGKPLQTPNPLRVTVALDETTSTESVVLSAGGTVIAEGSDGTKYTLVIPENALLSDQEVRMTPVASIDGLPLSGGLVAAIELRPEGLLLFEPATLTIELPDDVSADSFLGFSFLHSGEELFLYPTEVTSNTIHVQVMHFSGYGGGSGSSQDSLNMDKYPPSSAQNQAQQAAASATSKAGGQIPYDEFEDILRDWYTSSVKPNLKAATTDDSAMEASITEFLRWAVQVARCGLTDKFTVELDNGKIDVSKAIKNAVQKVSQRCSSQSNPAEARRLMRLARMSLLLGEEWAPGSAQQAEKALIEVARCGRFELKFDSIIESEAGCQANFISHVRATVQLKVAEGVEAFLANQYKGEGDLEYVDFSPPSGCPEEEGTIMCPAQSTGKQGSTFQVVGATLFNLNFSEEADSQPPSISVTYSPGNPTETMIVKCPEAESVEVFKLMQDLGLGEVRMWRDGYKATHKDETLDLGGGEETYVAQDWDYSGGSLYARKLYQGKRGETELGFSVIEDTTMDLFHKPG